MNKNIYFSRADKLHRNRLHLLWYVLIIVCITTSCVGKKMIEPRLISKGRIIHRFFDTCPVSPSGKYIALFRLPYENESPKPGDEGEVVVIDLQDLSEVCVIKTSGWETQLGANVQWGASDNALFYNDVDTSTWDAFTVQLDPVSLEKKRISGSVFMVSPDGNWLATNDLKKSRFAQVGYGVIVPSSEVSRNIGLSDQDGIFVTDIAANQSTLVASIKDIYDRSVPSITIEKPFEYEYYCFQVKWNPQGTRLLTSIQWTPLGGGERKRAIVTMKPDGSDIRTAITPEQWSKGGHHINWAPDGERLTMNLNVDGKVGLELITVKYDGSELKEIYSVGSGHPSLHPRGLPYIITDAYAGEMPISDTLSPIRLINLSELTEENAAEVFLPTITDFEFRVDAHPAWDRTGKSIIYNAVENGTRCVYLLNVTDKLRIAY